MNSTRAGEKHCTDVLLQKQPSPSYRLQLIYHSYQKPSEDSLQINHATDNGELHEATVNLT